MVSAGTSIRTFTFACRGILDRSGTPIKHTQYTFPPRDARLFSGRLLSAINRERVVIDGLIKLPKRPWGKQPRAPRLSSLGSYIPSHARPFLLRTIRFPKVIRPAFARTSRTVGT